MKPGLPLLLLLGTMRVQRTLPSAASSAASLVLVGLTSELWRFLLFPLSMALFHMASSVVNDLSDCSVDRVNVPGRALPSGRVSRGFLQALFVLLFGGGLLAAFALDFLYFLAAGTFGFIYVLAYSYGPSFKNRPLGSFAYYTLSGSAAPYVMASLMARSLGFDSLVFASLLALLATCAVMGSMGDYEGDLRGGKKTLPVALGFDRARRVLAAMVLGAAAAYPALYHVFSFSPAFPIFAVLPLSLRAALFYLVLRCNNPQAFRRLSPLYRVLIAADMTVLALTWEG
ncbi:UbiA family prenyltransferase [Candidatus Hecatella orcuttiae]|uniref:UbiA family prenyltransferase n=1 Tax=Candidatus Hecatella orcuttiae TaxID=1935119 RepID=UPI00286809E9|nr:UbiA family prenyltransferase [Candidatus Hecatella orcuttiae]